MWELRFEITSEKWTILEVVLSKLEPAAITTAYGDTDLFHSYSNVAKISHWEKLEVIVLFKDVKQVDLACSFLVKVEGFRKP